MHAVEIKKFRKRRSNRANNYYWGVIVKILSEETGFFGDEIHELLKRKFLAYEKPNQITGEIELFARSTTSLDSLEAEVFYEQIRVWAISELSVYIPLPNEITNYDS